MTEERIELPTEYQWQRAALGDTDWNYAYGPGIDQTRCNWNLDDGDLGPDLGTTPVTQYEGRGDSPFGVVDMTGNVWECCRTKYETGENDLGGSNGRVARGGSWVLMYSYVLNISAKERMYLNPFQRINYIGFRCARY